MCTTLIIPGLNGSPEGHWQHHWLRDDPSAMLVEQDDWNCPVLEDWLARFEAALARVESAHVVAHSLGCLLVANMARRGLAEKIKSALLVAPVSLERVEALHPCIVNFGELPLDELPFKTLIVASDNDPYLDVTELPKLVSRWGSDVINLGEAGHINIASGFGRWPTGYRLSTRLLQHRSENRSRFSEGARRSFEKLEHPSCIG